MEMNEKPGTDAFGNRDKAEQRLKRLAVLGTASVLFFATNEARADSIDWPLMLLGGLLILIPLLAFKSLIEALVLRAILKIPYGRVLSPSLFANLVSTAAGIPVTIYSARLYEGLPTTLDAYFREYTWAILVVTGLYFLVTFFVEYLIVLGWGIWRAFGCSPRRVALGVIAANLATYAVLVPWHYMISAPANNIREFTSDSAWASCPAPTIYFVDRNTKNLCSITTDGRERQVLIHDAVRDYQFSSNKGWFLYRNGLNELCLLRQTDKTPIVCWKASRNYTMNQVACNSDGTIVAYLDSDAEFGPFTLVLLDPDSGRRVKVKDLASEFFDLPGIMWLRSGSVLIFNHDINVGEGHEVEAFRIGEDLSATPISPELAHAVPLEVYGRFRTSRDNCCASDWSTGDDWGPNSFGSELLDGDFALTLHDRSGYDDRLCVGKRDGSRISLGLSPSVLNLAASSFLIVDQRRSLKDRAFFCDVCFIHDGNELIFNDTENIYLLDVAQRKIGWITNGSRFIIMSDRYRRRLSEKEEWRARARARGS